MSSGQAPKLTPERLNLTLGVVAVLALALGVWQIRTFIYSPFAYSGPANVNTTAAAGTTGGEGADVQALRARDTDSDGLSDYDELYLYRTSPYLKDSDSDGIDDKTEVTKGTDPNCAAGQTCGPSTFKGAGATQPTPAASGATTPTADQIRAFLKNNGATPEQLAKYDDATLLKLYGEVVASQPAGSSSASTGTAMTPNLTAEQKAALLELSPAELRRLLIKGGADATALSKVDDATLRALVRQSLGL